MISKEMVPGWRATVLLLAGGMLATPVAWAQEEEPAPAPTPSAAATAAAAAGGDAEPEEFGGNGRFFGYTELITQYTDNFYYQNDRVPNRSAAGFLLKPKLSYRSAAPTFGFTGGGAMAIGLFSRPGTADDFYDAEANAGIRWQPAVRHHLTYRMHVKKGHDPFGLDRTENTPREDRSLDRWVREDYRLFYRYGTPRGTYDVETSVFVANKAFHTNRGSTRFLDHDNEGGQATLFYNYSPKTKFLLDVLASHINFNEDFPGVPSRDGDDYKVRGGLRWLATAKTTGDFRIGYTTHTFSDPARPTFRGLNWQLSLSWAPESYRLFSLSSGRQALESYNSAGFIDHKNINAAWVEQWTSLLKTRVGTGVAFRKFVNTPRDDTIYSVNVSADYRLLSNLILFGSYDYATRGSSDDVFEFSMNTVALGIRVVY